MDITAELKNYLDKEGRLKMYPSKRKYKILALMFLASRFEKGVRYTEKEVNEILDEVHTFNDRCMMRRELYNNRFFGRLNDCSWYWLEEKQPVLSDFNIEM
ncbi:MAG: DUF2087 domain-containing protein [Bacillota bacterium]|nr:DUF2087 domain-containing protein [Bacillota bacterium]